MEKKTRKLRVMKEKLSSPELDLLKFPEFVFIYYNKTGKLILKTDLNRFPKSVKAGVYLFNSLGKVEKKSNFIKEGD